MEKECVMGCWTQKTVDWVRGQLLVGDEQKHEDRAVVISQKAQGDCLGLPTEARI